MNKIKFSHHYHKLGYGNDVIVFAKLYQVFKCHYEDLSESFIYYNTLYWKKGERYSKPSFCKLPKSELIILIFGNNYDENVFTTIRKYTPIKYEYYKSKMGEIFEVIIKEKNDTTK